MVNIYLRIVINSESVPAFSVIPVTFLVLIALMLVKTSAFTLFPFVSIPPEIFMLNALFKVKWKGAPASSFFPMTAADILSHAQVIECFAFILSTNDWLAVTHVLTDCREASFFFIIPVTAADSEALFSVQ